MALPFEVRDPFPLVDLNLHSHREIQVHSKAVDEWLGFELLPVESKIEKFGCRRRPNAAQGIQNLWAGLDPQDLQTPYVELRAILAALPLPLAARIVDFGSAYGRLGFVMARHLPSAEFLGFEFVGERVLEFERVKARHNLKRAQVRHADLTSSAFALPEADCYFIYDFGHRSAIERILSLLRIRAERLDFYLVARGRQSLYSLDGIHASWAVKASSVITARTQLYRCGPGHQEILRDKVQNKELELTVSKRSLGEVFARPNSKNS